MVNVTDKEMEESLKANKTIFAANEEQTKKWIIFSSKLKKNQLLNKQGSVSCNNILRIF